MSSLGGTTVWASVTTIAEYVEYTDVVNATYNVTSENGDAYKPFGNHSIWSSILIILVGSTLSIFTTTANAMVFLSFYLDKQLQVVNNYFLLSLAVADVIIGSISMPLFTLYLLQETWSLGPIVCDTWLSIDYAASNASVMNLCIICFDRYFSITRPLTYRANRTPKKAKIMIAMAWLISIFIWIPLIVGWQFFPFINKRTVANNECYIQFLSDNVVLNVLTILIAFYVPVTLMCTLYWRIWRETENRAKEFCHLQAGSISTNGSTGKHLLSHDDSIEQVERRESTWRSRCICCAIADIGPEDGDSEDSSDVVSPQPSTNTNTSSTKSRTGVPNHICNSASSPKNSPRLSPPTRLKRAASSGAAVPNNDKSFAASLYTILIKLPDEHSPEGDGKMPSITLVEGVVKTEADIIQDEEGSHLVPPHGNNGNNHATLPRARSDSVTSQPAPRRGSTTRLGTVRGGSGGGPLSISTISMVNKMASRAKTNVVKKRKSAIIREKKAARTLCAILSVFIVTWTPYSILILVTKFFSNSTTDMLFNISYWLCYLNSTINPICYALCNANFRRAFKRILTCKCKRQTRYQGAHRKMRHVPSPSRKTER